MITQECFENKQKELQILLGKLRRLRGLTQDDLAVQIDMSSKSISDIETYRRKASLQTLLKIYFILGIDLCELIKESISNE